VLVWFIVLYPCGIAASFFILLWFKREALFGPMDFADQSDFSRLLLRKVERIEVKQDAATIADRNAGIEDILRTVDRLLELDDSWSAIGLGRAFFKRNEYDKSLKVFERIKPKLNISNEAYYKLIGNIAYSQIGLHHYKDAIDLLLEVKKLNRGRDFGPWHALALAYANLKINNMPECEKWINWVRRRGAEDLDLEFFKSLYPEMAEQIEELSNAG
jgi:tetratricopeptide (TPR) repeat protein